MEDPPFTECVQGAHGSGNYRSFWETLVEGTFFVVKFSLQP